MREPVEEVWTNFLAKFCYGSNHTDVQMLDDQLELISNSSVRTQDVV